MSKERTYLRIIPAGFDTPGREIKVPAGLTVAQLIERFCAGGPQAQVLFARVEGRDLDDISRLETIVGPNQHITLCVVPLGAGNGPVSKETMRLLGAVGFELAGIAVPMMLGLGGIQEYAVRAGITLLGILAVNTLIPPLKDSEEVNVNYSGTRNSFRPGGRVPMPYGKTLYAPPLAAKPYTEVRGGRLYLKTLYALGYRPVKAHLNTMRIGDNHIREYPALRYNLIDGFTRARSLRDRTRFEIYNDAVSVEELVLDDELKYPGRTAAPWGRIVRTQFQHHVETLIYTTKDKTQQFSLDLTFPSGLHGSSSTHPASIRVQIQYQLDSGAMTNDNWISVTSDEHTMYTTNGVHELTDLNIFNWLNSVGSYVGTKLDELLTFPIDNWSTQPGITDALDALADDILALIETVATEPYLTEGSLNVLDVLVTRCERLKNSMRNCRASWARVGIAGIDYDFGNKLTSIHGLLIAVPVLLRLQYALYMGVTEVEIEQSDDYAQFTEVRQLRTDIYGQIHTGEIIISNATKQPLKYTFGTRVPEGRYRVRVRKVTENVSVVDGEEVQADGYQDQVYVTSFRSIIQSRPINENVAGELSFLEMEVPVTDTVNGSLNEVSLILETPLHFSEDGETWLPRAVFDSTGRAVSRNPAWIYVDILCGNATISPASLDEIDLPRIYEWAEYCYTAGLYYDKVIDNDDLLENALDEVCQAGKAMRTLRDGLYSVAIDKPQDTLSMVITPYNSRDFNFTKSMMPVPHALNIQFRNPAKDWSSDNIYVYNDGYGRAGDISRINRRCTPESNETIVLPFKVVNLTSIYDNVAEEEIDLTDVSVQVGRESTTLTHNVGFLFERSRYTVRGTVLAQAPQLVESLLFPGMVDVPEDPSHEYFTGQAERMGKYLLRAIVHRPEVFTVEMDYESLLAQAGDRVTLQHDVVAWGLGSGRVISVNKTGSNVNWVKIDQRAGLADGTYAIKIRKSDNSIWGPYDVTLDNDFPDRWTLTSPQAEGALAIGWGDLVVWGERRLVGIDCIIRKVHPRRFLEQQVTLVEASPQIHDSDDEPVGDYNPNLTFPRRPELKKPPKPSITEVITNETALVRDADGSIRLGILVRFELANTSSLEAQFSQPEVDTIDVQYQVSRPIRPGGRDMAPPWVGAGKFDAGAGQVHITGVEQSNRYNVRIRSLARNGVLSDWEGVYNVFVEGTLAPPPDVSAQTIRVDAKLVTWSYNPPIDFAGFRVRYGAGRCDTWEELLPAHNGLLVESRIELTNITGGYFTIGIKAVDVGGNESRNAAMLFAPVFDEDIGHPVLILIGGPNNPVGILSKWGSFDLYDATEDTGTDFVEVDTKSADKTTSYPFTIPTRPWLGGDITRFAFSTRHTEASVEIGRNFQDWVTGMDLPYHVSVFPIVDAEFWQLQRKNANSMLWGEQPDDLIWQESDDADFWPNEGEWHPVQGFTLYRPQDQWSFRVWFPEREGLTTEKSTLEELYYVEHFPEKTDTARFITESPGEYSLTHGIDFSVRFNKIVSVDLTIVENGTFPDVRFARLVSGMAPSGFTVRTYDDANSYTQGEVIATIRGF